MNQPWIYMYSPSRSPLSPPSPPDPSGSSQCTRSEHLSRASNLGWMKLKSLSRVLLFTIAWTVAYQALWSMGFSRQEYWSGLPFPSPGIFQTQGSNLGFLHCQFSSVAQSCPTLRDPMNCNMPGLPVHHKLLEFTQTHAHRVGDAIQPSHPLSSPSLPALQADALLSELPGKPNKENTSSLSLRRITHLYLPCLSLNFSFWWSNFSVWVLSISIV